MADLVGKRIDRYHIEAVLGSGASGTVYRARHALLGTTIALKVFAPHKGDAEVARRFVQEAQAVASLGHPNIVSVHDAGVADGERPFIAMEPLQGETLAERLEREEYIVVGDALSIARQVLAGLGAAHAAGIIHRDVKPENVFLTSQADEQSVRLLDFGVSKATRSGERLSELTAAGSILGTPAYMPPEQLNDARAVDARADLYAVAVLLYRMLSGRLPYRAESIRDLVGRESDNAPVPLRVVWPQAPRALSDALERAMANEVSLRYPNAEAMSEALHRAATEIPATARALTAVPTRASKLVVPPGTGLSPPSAPPERTSSTVPMAPAIPATRPAGSLNPVPLAPSAPPRGRGRWFFLFLVLVVVVFGASFVAAAILGRTT